MTATQIDVAGVTLGQATFQHGKAVTFAAAGTYAKGTILAVNTSTGKYVPFVKGGSVAGNGVVGGVLTYDLVRTTAGAGDETADVLIAGDVKLERLVINADGDASNIDAVVELALRDKSIIPVKTSNVGVY